MQHIVAVMNHNEEILSPLASAIAPREDEAIIAIKIQKNHLKIFLFMSKTLLLYFLFS
jgi:hypothetical protein